MPSVRAAAADPKARKQACSSTCFSPPSLAKSSFDFASKFFADVSTSDSAIPASTAAAVDTVVIVAGARVLPSSSLVPRRRRAPRVPRGGERHRLHPHLQLNRLKSGLSKMQHSFIMEMQFPVRKLWKLFRKIMERT